MPQQINLFSPILLAPRHHLSARTMAAALGLLVAGTAALCAWATLSTAQLRSAMEAASAVDEAERQRLLAAQAARPAARDNAALAQELAHAERQLAQREELLQGAGDAPSAGHPARWLAVVARGLPDSAWLTELQLAGRRFSVSGRTQRPELLRPWLEHLLAEGGAERLSLRELKVDRLEASAAEAVPTWSFHAEAGPAGEPTR